MAFEDLSFEERLARLEAAQGISLKDLPMRALQDKLELDWQPNASLLLPPGSVSTDLLADASVTAAKIAAPEAVRFIGNPGEPAFTNSWVNFTAGTPSMAIRAAGFYKDRGRVYLTGVIKSGVVGAAAFTLPAGYLPPASWSFEAMSNELRGQVNVSSAGVVTPQVGNNAYFFLEGISFRAA